MMSLHHLVWRAATKFVVDRRPPDVVIGGDATPYLRRWWVIPRNRWFNVYLHQFVRSDDDRALHDHPWWNISWLLKGNYLEVLPVKQSEPSGETRYHLRTSGSFVFRKSEFAHRIQLCHCHGIEMGCWTLFITGPVLREWGFWCPKGWRHWKDFTGARTGGSGHEIGPGCGE